MNIFADKIAKTMETLKNENIAAQAPSAANTDRALMRTIAKNAHLNITDELAGTWVLNDTLDLEAPLALALADFCANEESYKGIAILTEAQIGFDRVLAFRTADNTRFTPIARRNRSTQEIEWLDDTHKTLIIDSNFSEVVNGGELLLWLQANAIKQQINTEGE